MLQQHCFAALLAQEQPDAVCSSGLPLTLDRLA
jgi:hypothetical protein